MATLSLRNWVPAWFGFGHGSTAGHRKVGVQMDGTTQGKPITQDTALALSSVWACTKLISETVASMPINFYRKNSDGTRELDRDFHLSKLLNENPSRWQTGVEYRSTISASQAMLGNDYSLKQFAADGRLIGLLPLMAAQMRVELLDSGERIYIYHTSKARIVYPSARIWHNMLMPSNGVIGLSPLKYAARTMNIADASEDRVATAAQNGFKPTGVLLFDKVLDEDQRTSIRKSFAELASGQGESIQVLEADMKYQQISLSPKDAQLLETRRFQLEDIARFWGVPSVLINDTAKSTVWGSGIKEIVQGFYKFTIRPYLERYEAAITKNLMTSEERMTHEVEFDFSSLLREDETTRIKNAAAEISGGLKTINEARKDLDGSEPVEGGNKIYLQQQMTPIEELANDAAESTSG